MHGRFQRGVQGGTTPTWNCSDPPPKKKKRKKKKNEKAQKKKKKKRIPICGDLLVVRTGNGNVC